MMKSFKFACCIIALMAGAAGSAHAASVNLTYQSVTPGQTVGVSLVRGGSTVFSGNTRAGVFNFLDDMNQLVQTFCIDLHQYVRLNNAVAYDIQYDLTAAPIATGVSTQPISPTGVALLREFYGEYVSTLNLSTISNSLAAAIGLITWELSHENAANGYSLTAGDFTASIGTALLDTANSLLANVLDNGSIANADLVALTNGNWQDQLTFAANFTPPGGGGGQPIPTPAASGLGLAGLLIVALRRRLA